MKLEIIDKVFHNNKMLTGKLAKKSSGQDYIQKGPHRIGQIKLSLRQKTLIMGRETMGGHGVSV